MMQRQWNAIAFRCVQRACRPEDTGTLECVCATQEERLSLNQMFWRVQLARQIYDRRGGIQIWRWASVKLKQCCSSQISDDGTMLRYNIRTCHLQPHGLWGDWDQDCEEPALGRRMWWVEVGGWSSTGAFSTCQKGWSEDAWNSKEALLNLHRGIFQLACHCMSFSSPP